MNAKVVVIDTDKTDLKALGAALGVDLEKLVAEATGEVDGCEGCEDCDCDEEADLDMKYDEDFGSVVLEDDNASRQKTVFKFANTSANEVKVVEGIDGVTVSATNRDGQEFSDYLYAPDATIKYVSAHFVGDELAVRFYKVPEVPGLEEGRNVEIKNW